MTDGGPIRVVLADDHAPTREEMRSILEDDDRFVVVADVADAPAAIAAAVRARPHLCMLDIEMPGSGLAAAWEITARLPQTRVVMLTISAEDRHLFAALRAGAAGYLLKDADPAELPDTLARVAAGEAVLAPSLIARVVTEFRDRSARRRSASADGPEGQLTSREWEVLDLLRQGQSTSQIARRLVLSPVTIRTHIASILRKLRVADRDELLRQFPGR